MPLVSFVIPALNAATTITQTLDSLVNQTFKDFDVYIVNDGSQDATSQCIEQYAGMLQINEIVHERCVGVAASLNDGVLASDSQFIARLDADDIAFPHRLERQLALMHADRQVDVCGTHCEFFNGATLESAGFLTHPPHHAGIKTAMLQRNAIAHPSAIIRRSFFEQVGLYDSNADFAEDYDLWCRGISQGRIFQNIPEVLTRYRLHAMQVSNVKSKLQLERDIVVKRSYVQALLGGKDPAWLPYFLSLAVNFGQPKQAAQALADSSAVLAELAAKELDPIILGELLRNAFNRHLVNVL